MKTIIGAFLMLACSIAYGQVPKIVSFGYDLSGNRILREIVMAPIPPKSAADTTGIDEPEQGYNERLAGAELFIYPNPTQGRLMVAVKKMPEGAAAALALFDMQGKQIIRKEHLDATTELDISSHPSGSYLLRISIGERESTWKIIKQ